jgi:RNA polymerase-binding transcription factor DksA
MTRLDAFVAPAVTLPTSPISSALQAERERRVAQVAALTTAFADVVAASEGANADDEHDPEGATIAFERSQVGAQIAHAQASVAEFEEALSRLEAGRYGICTSCDQAIAAARLEARPAASTCIACAR